MDRFKPHHKYKEFLIGDTYKIRDYKKEDFYFNQQNHNPNNNKGLVSPPHRVETR